MSKEDCCKCPKPCPSPFNTELQRPKNGVLTVNKVIAKQAVCTPQICSKTGIVCVAGVDLGSPTVSLNSGLNVGDRSCYTNGLVAQTNSNLTIGTWATIDLSAAEYPILSGNTANNCLFIGSDDVPAGFKYIPKLAQVGLSGDSSWEYWNGASWVEIDVMAAQGSAPHEQFANTPFERVSVDPENTRIEDVALTWVKNELNSITKFWLRLCLSNNIATIPIISDLQLIASHTNFNNDGFAEQFGMAMPLREIIFHRKLLETVNGLPPSSEDIRLAAGFNIDGVSNEFVNTQTDAIAGIFRIPTGTDTSNKMQLCLAWYPLTAAAGDVEWTIEYINIRQGDDLNNNALIGVTDIMTTATPAANGVLTETKFEVPIEMLVPRELLAIKISRAGTAPADTYTGNVVLADVAALVKRWS